MYRSLRERRSVSINIGGVQVCQMYANTVENHIRTTPGLWLLENVNYNELDASAMRIVWLIFTRLRLSRNLLSRPHAALIN